jgi:hypothetical protein
MNLKSKVILLTVVFSVSAISVYSLGVFKNNPTPTEESTTTITKKPIGIFAADKPTPGDDAPVPVGESLTILSILSGGYFMLKRSKRKKE